VTVEVGKEEEGSAVDLGVRWVGSMAGGMAGATAEVVTEVATEEAVKEAGETVAGMVGGEQEVAKVAAEGRSGVEAMAERQEVLAVEMAVVARVVAEMAVVARAVAEMGVVVRVGVETGAGEQEEVRVGEMVVVRAAAEGRSGVEVMAEREEVLAAAMGAAG
jgi:hypothetical protein